MAPQNNRLEISVDGDVSRVNCGAIPRRCATTMFFSATLVATPDYQTKRYMDGGSGLSSAMMRPTSCCRQSDLNHGLAS